MLVKNGFILSIFLAASVFFSCQVFKEKILGVNEGIITYNVSFPGMKKGSMASSLMPSEVLSVFKKHKTRVEMSIGYGLVKMIYITDYELKQNIIMIDMMGKKTAYKTTPEEINAELANLPKYEFQFTNEEKDILGYKCHKVIVADSVSTHNFEVFYTKEINPERIYWNTPYNEIEGALMQYSITQMGIPMELIANKIEIVSVSDILFSVPKEYTLVSKEEFEKIMGDLIAVGMN